MAQRMSVCARWCSTPPSYVTEVGRVAVLQQVKRCVGPISDLYGAEDTKARRHVACGVCNPAANTRQVRLNSGNREHVVRDRLAIRKLDEDIMNSVSDGILTLL